MSAKCAALLSELLQDSTHFIEYGAGGSTRFASEHAVQSITTVESDARFLDALKPYFASRTPEYWTPIHVDLGPVTALGYPKTLKAQWRWMRYALSPWKVRPDADLVLIDGRFRLACALATAWYAKPGTRVFFDDYLLRPWYRKTEDFLTLVSQKRRAFVFEVNGDRPAELRTALIRAVSDPR
jgi:hypothetical protein